MHVSGSEYFQSEGVYLVIMAGIILFAMLNKWTRSVDSSSNYFLMGKGRVESDVRNMNQSGKLEF